MSNEPIDPAAAAEAIFEDQVMTELQSYLADGRRFSDFDDQQLRADWVDAARAWIASLDNDEWYTQMSDLAAEAELRGIEMPYDLVAGGFQVLPDADIAKNGFETPEVRQIIAGFSRAIKDR